MSPLAHEIYRQLLRALRAGKPSLTYGELAGAISRRHPTHHRSPSFHTALGELTEVCRTRGLPALPAMVWRASGQSPGRGYYTAAHPRARTERSRREAWEREHADVVRAAATFPPTL